MSTLRHRRRPVVGVTGDITTSAPTSPQLPQEPLVFLGNRYTEALTACGAVPLILPPLSARAAIAALLERLDGVLVSGGNFDIHPKLYREEPCANLGEIKEERTRFELELISLALQRNTPMLGICGGEQAINIVLGGSLYQDIRTQLPPALEHQLGASRTEGGHVIKIRPGTKLREIVAKDQLDVNTTHHQAVKTLGRGLIVSATSEDNVVEAIESENHSFVIGLQWHPELLIHKDPAQTKILVAFVSACRDVQRSVK